MPLVLVRVASAHAAQNRRCRNLFEDGLWNWLATWRCWAHNSWALCLLLLFDKGNLIWARIFGALLIGLCAGNLAIAGLVVDPLDAGDRDRRDGPGVASAARILALCVVKLII